MKRMVSLALLLAMLMMCLSGCSLLDELLDGQAEPETTDTATMKVEDTVARCVAACNRVDVDGILDCISPTIAKPARTMLKLAGSLSKQSDEEMLKSVLDLLGAEETENCVQVCQTLSATVERVEVDGDEATAKISFSFTDREEPYQGSTNASFVCIDGRWYLKMLSA